MKKFTAVTTALALSLAMAPAYVFAAPAAAGGECAYPTDFSSELTFTALADYAINGDERAFAESTKLYVIAPDEYGDDVLKNPDGDKGYDCGFQITDIEYGDDGTLYLRSTDGSVATYPDLAPAAYDFESDGPTVAGGYDYRLIAEDGELYAIAPDNRPVTIFEEGCTHLKIYDGKAYVMNGGRVYLLDGTTPEEQTAQYTDFGKADNIAAGDAAELLLSPYEVRTVTVKPQTTDGHDTYVTKIDIESIGDTFRALGTEKLTGDRSALAIAETGNATIIVMRDEDGLDQSYITLTAAVENSDYSPPENDMTHACAREDTYIYSRPYMCGATAIGMVPGGTTFTVTEKFERQYLGDTYYRVTCNADGREITGFVHAGMLSPYSFSSENEPEQSTGSDDFVFDDSVKTVIIVLLIVLLTLVAAGCVIFYLTRKGDGRTRRRRTPPRDNDDLYS